MSRRDLPLSALRAFDATMRYRGFTAAAVALGVTQGAVSYQIKRLEEQLGLPLFRREGRGATPTPEGERLSIAVARALDDLANAIDSVRQDHRTGLAISISTYLASRWLSPRLASFIVAWPDLSIRLLHGAGGEAPLPEDADVALVWGRLRAARHNVVPLFESPLSPVCAPHLAASGGALERGPLLHDDEMRNAWSEWFTVAGMDPDRAARGPVIPDPNVRMQAVIDGQGLALADSLVDSEILAGRMTRPVDVALPGYGYLAMFRDDIASKPAATAFLDWVVAESARR
jgi:DNA-binding transcriptional LysR family regulator